MLLLDEPDAHLEILRQRQIYQLLTEVAQEQDSQIIIASHSEVLLNEAGDRDVVVAFVGSPHRIDDRGSQLGKALISATSAECLVVPLSAVRREVRKHSMDALVDVETLAALSPGLPAAIRSI